MKFDRNRCTLTGVLEGEIELREGHARDVAVFTLRVNGLDPDGPGAYSQLVSCVARDAQARRARRHGPGVRLEVEGWLCVAGGQSTVIAEWMKMLPEPAMAF